MKENISLKELTTFRIGGVAKYFCSASNREEIIEAIKWAKQNPPRQLAGGGLPFFVLAGGSNILINDKKYKGLIIKVQSSKFKVQSCGEKFLNSEGITESEANGSWQIIEAESGTPLGKIVGLALQNSLTGMEWAMAIPGTIGGAIYGNAGAFSSAIGDVIESVEAIDFENQELRIRNYEKEECKFKYRDSVFKRNKNLIILSVKIKLQTGDKAEIEKKMADFFRMKKQTQPLEFFSAGSVFKNYELRIKNQEELIKKNPELKQFQDKNIIPAAWLIEKAFLKGKRIGGAEISQKHANFIVNNGRAKAKDVKKLIDLIKKQVKKKFNIILEEEIQYLNF